ncbi:hypothetical protein CYY_000124 [Polysphondylium violaceum]|uniref:Carbohydrate binding domain-containing protein n=1 Tax=Polysphondylium violaceum TaxID=133409 RepID=A0A8J4Q5D6_9MYCE|nr:hypothetical protein CYY_000124 [Polysphondylium violaceum]
MKLKLYAIVLLFLVVSPSFAQFLLFVDNHSNINVDIRVSRYEGKNGDGDDGVDTWWRGIPPGQSYPIIRAFPERGYIITVRTASYTDSWMVYSPNPPEYSLDEQGHLHIWNEHIQFRGAGINYTFKFNRNSHYFHTFTNSNHAPVCFGGETYGQIVWS